MGRVAILGRWAICNQDCEEKMKCFPSDFVLALRRHWQILLLAILAVNFAVSKSRIDWTLVLAAAGILLNCIVVCANQGRMPVLTRENEDADSMTHKNMERHTRLRFLADWIPLGERLMISPGDVFLWTGLSARLIRIVFGLYA